MLAVNRTVVSLANALKVTAQIWPVVTFQWFAALKNDEQLVSESFLRFDFLTFIFI